MSLPSHRTGNPLVCVPPFISSNCVPSCSSGLWVRPGQAYVCTDTMITALWTDPRTQELLVSSLCAIVQCNEKCSKNELSLLFVEICSSMHLSRIHFMHSLSFTRRTCTLCTRTFVCCTPVAPSSESSFESSALAQQNLSILRGKFVRYPVCWR